MINTIRNIVQFDYQLAQRQSSFVIIVFISAALCGYWLLYPAQIALLMPDSTSYIRFQDYRGAGYPLFLAICRLFGLSVEQTTIIQSLCFFAGLAFLAQSFSLRFRSIVLSIALLIGIGLNPAIVRYCFSIVTESVYFTSLFIFLGLILRINSDKHTNIYLYCLIGMLFAWLILIKPVSWSLIVVPILLLWQHLTLKHNILKIGCFILAGFILMQLCGTAYRYSQHQQISGGSFFGNQLIGKLAFTDFDPEAVPYPAAGKLWLSIMTPSHQARDEFIENHHQRFLFALNTYDFLRFDNMPAIVEAMNTTDTSSAQKDLAMAILKQNPQSYFYDVGLNFYNLWAIGELQNKGNAIRYNQQIDKAVAKYQSAIPTPYRLNEENSLKVTVTKPLLLLAAIANFGLLFYALFQHIFRFKPMSSDIHSLLIMTASTNAYFLLTALLQAALTRYAIVAWPMHLILLLGLIAIIKHALFTQTEQV